MNGEVIRELLVTSETAEYVLHPEESEDGNYGIELKINSYFVSKDLDINIDVGKLSLQLYYLGAA